jgi:hypothetical protein
MDDLMLSRKPDGQAAQKVSGQHLMYYPSGAELSDDLDNSGLTRTGTPDEDRGPATENMMMVATGGAGPEGAARSSTRGSEVRVAVDDEWVFSQWVSLLARQGSRPKMLQLSNEAYKQALELQLMGNFGGPTTAT